MTTVARRKDPLQYIPIDQAIEKYDLDRTTLDTAIENGDIETAEVVDSDAILLLDESLRAWLAERITPSRFKHLEGQPISVNEASKKYGFHYSTIMHWIERGEIKSLGIAPGYKKRMLVDESEIAYARALADLKQPISGQSVFS